MEEMANTFQDAFLKNNFETVRTLDWAKGLIVLEFTRKQPTSDHLRHVIFDLYHRKWGQKPNDLDVVYRTGPGRPGAYYSANSPICIYITGSASTLSDLLRKQRHVVLDKVEFSEWREKLAWEDRIEGCDPGQPVPVIKMGLFKV